MNTAQFLKLGRKNLFIAIGNEILGDDSVAIYFLKKIKEICHRDKKFAFLNVGTTPENYVGKIVKENPDTVIIIDSVLMDLPVGTIKILTLKDVKSFSNLTTSTHNISLKIFIEFLLSQIKPKIYIIAIQPKSIGFNEEISDEVRKSINEFVTEFSKVQMK